MKSGFKSTEFWINLIGMVGGLVLAGLGENQWTTIAGGILSAVCGSSYAAGRSIVKGKEIQGAAQIGAAKELVKKSDPSSAGE